MQRVGVIVNQNKEGADKLLAEVRDWLSKRGCEVKTNQESSLDEIVKDAEFIVCAGGDGTILHVAHQMKYRSIPILGVNLGSLGFITEVKKEELFEELKSIFAQKFDVEERSMLSCHIKNTKTNETRRFQALNDIVINREGLTRYLRVEITIGNEPFTSFSGDGVIISTPTGSTAYSLSAGGPIVHPQLDSMIITAICPHVSSLRPMVVAGSEKIQAKVTCDNPEEHALLVSDGQNSLQVSEVHSISVTQSDAKLQLVKSSQRSYFQTLREKFKIPL